MGDDDGDRYRFHDLLDPAEQEVLDRVRHFMRGEVAPVIDEYWAKAEFPHHLVGPLAATGLADLACSHCPGPTASSLLKGFVAAEMARVDPSFATFYGAHAGLAMASIERCGSPEQRRRWLPAMGRLDLVGAFALTEPEGGSDVAGGMRTKARRDGDEWVLDGAKRWIGNATFADLVVVWAKGEGSAVHAFVVEKDTPGFTASKIEGKVALRVTQNADLTFDSCRVPEANRLAGANTFRDTADVLRRSRAGVAWEACGVMLAAYDVALDYTREREQFGRPLASFQLVQDLLVKILGNATASLGMAVRLAQLEDAGTYRDEHSSLAKAFCTSRMREAVGWARELLGGNGIVLDYGIAKFVADAEALYS
nr:acyl-CoA dehydrogenase family protein [Micromonospora sp. DSM 115978]